MSKIIRKLNDGSIENMIATAMIVSPKFLSEIHPIYDKEYIKSPHLRKVGEWCMDFFEYHEEAPQHHIYTAFELDKPNLKSEEIEIIQNMLVKISEDYKHRGINEEYYLNKAFQYFKTREMEITSLNVQRLLELGRVEEAEAYMDRYQRVERITSGWSNPMDEKSIMEVFEKQEEGLFTMPGQLGALIGKFDRGWLVGILGSFKRGKTFWMVEIAAIAVANHLKVAIISLEMKNTSVNERYYKRIASAGHSSIVNFAMPVFDCKLNQTGECEKPQRVNQHTVVVDDIRQEFDPASPYRPCTWCRDHEPIDYVFDTWWEMMERPKFSEEEVFKKVGAFKGMYGDNIRLKCYPRFTATVDDIKRDLDILEKTDNFLPDVIIIDYADIIKPTSASGRTQDVDEIWKELGGLAGTRNALVVTASQGRRDSIYKRSMTQADLAEWIGKLGHVDVMFALNQTKEEKRYGRMRIGLLAHRHQDFDEDIMCLVLQQLKLGQVELDSIMWNPTMAAPGGLSEAEANRRR